MRKITGVLCMIMGALLILSAAALVLYNHQEDTLAGESAQEILPSLVEAIQENAKIAENADTEIKPPQPTLDPDWEMTEAVINGYSYIGYLSIPVLDLELPVMSEWSYPKLRIAPCRQFGTTRGSDLVIAGHNYQNHFGTLNKLTDRDVIFFTDMNGEITCYRVTVVDVIPPDSTEEVENSPYDLILYTCTYGGKTRVMVGAVRISKQQLDEMLGQL